MNKGVTAIQNIYTLVLGIKYSIIVHYNILYSFPGDLENDYIELLKTIPCLYHLFPPESETKIGITRFSPLEQMYSSKNMLKAHDNYAVIFSNEFLTTYNFNLNKYCYYFNTPYSNSEQLEEYYTMLSYQVKYWKESRNKREVVLIFEDLNESIKFIDTRFKETGEIYELTKICRDVFMMCEMQINSQKNIIKTLSNYYDTIDIEISINTLSEYRFVFIEGDKILGLAFKIEYYKTLKRDNAFWSNHPVDNNFIDFKLKEQIKIQYEIAG